MRIIVRIWIRGELRCTDRASIHGHHDAALNFLIERHAAVITEALDDHMIEIEFVDEPDPLQRYFRFGTNPQKMVQPMKLRQP